jgi:methylmalonyl-CoA/ethylmalonyl-CoA epimerase
VIARFIEKKGEGMHHVAFAVDDLSAEIERLKQEGFIFISEEPRKGADNKLICFLHPKSTGGVLVELCQNNPE